MKPFLKNSEDFFRFQTNFLGKITKMIIYQTHLELWLWIKILGDTIIKLKLKFCPRIYLLQHSLTIKFQVFVLNLSSKYFNQRSSWITLDIKFLIYYSLIWFYQKKTRIVYQHHIIASLWNEIPRGFIRNNQHVLQLFFHFL